MITKTSIEKLPFEIVIIPATGVYSHGEDGYVKFNRLTRKRNNQMRRGIFYHRQAARSKYCLDHFRAKTAKTE